MTVVGGAVAGLLIFKFIVTSLFDPVCIIGILALFILVRKVQTDTKDFKSAYYAFLSLVGGQAAALSVALVIGFIGHIVGVMLPQSLINLIGVFPLVVGVAQLIDLLKEAGVLQRLTPCLKTNAYQSIGGGDENFVVKTSKTVYTACLAHVNQPFAVEAFLLYVCCFCNSIVAYKGLFWWLDTMTCLSVIITFNILIFFKTLAVLLAIQWIKSYSDCLCPVDCINFFFSQDLQTGTPKYIYSAVLIALGMTLLGQSVMHAVAPAAI